MPTGNTLCLWKDFRGQKGEDKSFRHGAKGTKSGCMPQWRPAVPHRDSGRRQDTRPTTTAVTIQMQRGHSLHQTPKVGTATYPAVQGWETSKSRCTLNIVGGCMGSQKTHSLS